MSERVSFVAVLPEDATLDLDSFDVVCSPNPEDVAQFSIKQLSTSNRITLMSFGPKTVTSHSYLIGKDSVLDSFLRSFVDAKREVKLFFHHAQIRYPSENPRTYYSINSEDDFEPIYAKLTATSALDAVKVTLVIECYSIILVSLPAFIPLAQQATGIKYATNSWKVVMDPSQLSDAKTFILLHFDTRLQTETTLMKFLTAQDKFVDVCDELPALDVPVSPHAVAPTDDNSNDDEYTYEYSDPEPADAQEDDWQKEVSEHTNGNNSVASVHSVAASAKSRQSVRSTAAESAKSRQSVRSIAVESIKSRKSIHSSVRGEMQNEIEESADDEVSVKSQHSVQQQSENIPRKRRRRRKKQVEEAEDTAATEISNADDVSSVVPTEENIEFEEPHEEEEEDTIEMEIQKFVAQLQMNVPALTDTSIFSTLFQQLFYEKWKSDALVRTKTAMSELRDKIKQKLTDETQGLKQLVESNDMTIFLVREEQKMRLLEKMSVETLEKALEKRVGSYANVPTRGLLRTFQQICGDHITLQKQIREKRAAIRSETMELRIAQAQRMEKLQKYHEAVAQLEKAAAVQTRMRKALAKHEQIEQELTQVEEERQALLQQLEKVKSVLRAKQHNVK